MALSMDEQRMLAEIERRLAAEDPGLAAKLSSFRRPGPATRLRSPRSKILGSLFFVVAVVAVVSIMVYAMVPFRAHSPKSITSPQMSGLASVTAPAKVGPAAGTSASAPAAAARVTSGTHGASHAGTAPASAKNAAKTGATRTTVKTPVRAGTSATHTP